jgi:hypothetical protein
MIPCAVEKEAVEASGRCTAFSRFLQARPRYGMALVLHWTLWGALLVTFAFRSAPILMPELVKDRVGPVDSLHSIDRCLWTVNGSEHSQRLVDMISRIPEKGRVIIFMREGSSLNALLGMAISYLAWPREVQMISGNDEMAAKELATIRPESVGAVIFCQTSPPAWFPAGVLYTPGVRIVYVKKTGSRP